MTALTSYSTGTVTVAANGTTVTGSGTIWSGVNVRPGDILQIGDFQTIIGDVTDTSHLVIPSWGGGAQSGATYTIYQVSPQRFVGAQAMADVSSLIAALNVTGFFVFVGPTETVPDPSYGNDGQYALQASTGKMWEKTGGVWVFVGIFRGFGTPAPWDSGTAYAVYDVATLNGTSYVCILAHTNHTPPNATYWAVLAGKGDTGPAAWSTPPAAWLTATAYTATAPASVVTQGGETYVCATSHTSGTFATDLAAAKWIKVAQKGADAPTYGGTSTTSLTIGTGSKAFTTQAGLAYQNGGRVRASSAANTSNWMEGLVTYSGTSLTIAVDKTNGSGTLADWNFNVVGQPGAGDLSSANNLSDLASPATAATNLGAVRYGGSQTLTSAQKAQARANIDALKKNYIINGAMRVSQENGTTAITAAGNYPVDQFFIGGGVTSGTWSAAQVASVTPGGSPNRLRFTVTSADASVAAGDTMNIVQSLEGYRVADLLSGSASAKTITIQFGVKAPAGTYVVALRNSAANRTYPAEYTIAPGEANTDVVKSVTVALDTSGTWLADNGIGIQIFWQLMGGSTYQGTPNTWASGNFLSTSNQFNIMGTNGNVFELFDVGVYEGAAAPSFQVPDYQVTLQECQRYLQPAIRGIGSAPGVHSSLGQRITTNLIDVPSGFFPELRTAPSLLTSSPTFSSAATPTGNQIGAYGATFGGYLTITGALTPSLVSASSQSAICRFTAGTSFNGSAGDAVQIFTGNTAKLLANARM